MSEATMTNPIFRDCFRDAKKWRTSHWYHLGDRVLFCGMLLRCGVDHYVGDQAKHPWDPGWGWGDGASLLWAVLTPEWMEAEAGASRELAESMRERVSCGF